LAPAPFTTIRLKGIAAKGVDEPGNNVFFGIDAVYGLVERIVEHIKNPLGDKDYIFSLVSHNLMALVNGNRVE
jgi:hypothetical protein